jgi:hypothetical protein
MTMKARLFGEFVFIVCMALILASCSSLVNLGAKTGLLPSTRILFIGNSYTYFNGGIDQHLEGLDPSSATQSIAVGGYTLQNHWNDGNALQTIRTGKWDYVVLQEQSQTPILDSGRFRLYAQEFDGAIKNSGAKTILLMTWERPDSVSLGVTTARLAAAYNAVGAFLGAKVAPAGIAFADSLRSKPDLQLYGADGHPTMYGTYLAACVVYATIFQHSPVGNPYADSSISSETRTYLQQIAAQSSGF